MRFVQQFVAKQCLMKFYQVRRRRKTASGRSAFDLPRAVVIPDFLSRMSVGRHLGIADREIWNLLSRLVETGGGHARRTVDMLPDITVVVLARDLFDNGTE